MEGEALLLGIWKNIEDLEESLNLPELELVIKSAHAREDRANKWLAAVNGIDIDGNGNEEKETPQDKLDKAFRKANLGRDLTPSEEEADALAGFGIRIEVE